MTAPQLTALDRSIILATQEGLPLTVRPYHALADSLGIDVAVIMKRLQEMLDSGTIRRIAAVPNLYRVGFAANGMTVWDVDDAMVDTLGAQVGALDFVTHSYRRPRRLPAWPYNLFAMVHGKSREECEVKASQIKKLLGAYCRSHTILYSKAVLKKTGFRLTDSNAAKGLGK